MPFADLVDLAPGETSATVRARVARVRRVQSARDEARRRRGAAPWLALDAEGKRILRDAHRRLGISARAHVRLVQVARTIGDLAGAERIEAAHVAEAIHYRALDHEAAREAARDAG